MQHLNECCKQNISLFTFCQKKKYKQKWFNGNCIFLKGELNNIGKKLRQYPDTSDFRLSCRRLRKEYKQLLKETKQKFVKSIVDKLDSLHENDLKLFWKTI